MTVFAGDPALAADINEALNRRVGTFEGTSDLTATSGTTEKLCDTVTTSSLKAGRKYVVSFFFPGAGSVAADNFLIRLRLGTTTGGTQLTYSQLVISSTSVVNTVVGSYDYTPSADGAVSFCTTAQRNTGGAGTVTPKGATSQPRYIRVDLATTA